MNRRKVAPSPEAFAFHELVHNVAMELEGTGQRIGKNNAALGRIGLSLIVDDLDRIIRRAAAVRGAIKKYDAAYEKDLQERIQRSAHENFNRFAIEMLPEDHPQ